MTIQERPTVTLEIKLPLWRPIVTPRNNRHPCESRDPVTLITPNSLIPTFAGMYGFNRDEDFTRNDEFFRD